MKKWRGVFAAGIVLSLSLFVSQTSYAITNPPVLTSPTSISTNTSPLTIVYVLPDSPGPGTEKLIFTGSATTYTLTLNHNSSGTYVLLLNMDDVVGSSGGHVIAASPASFLPDDTYSITVQYQNALFDPAASDTITNVIIDRDNPTITSLSPALSSVNVPTNASLQVVFSEKVFVDNGSAAITIRRASDNSVFDTLTASSGNVHISGKTLTITPSKPLEPGVTYYVQIANNAFADQVETSFAGINDTSTWRFTTAVSPAAASQAVASAPNTGTGDSSKSDNYYEMLAAISLVACGIGLFMRRDTVARRV